MNALDPRLAALTPEQRELLVRRLARLQGAAPDPDAIRPRPPAPYAETSLAQEEYWLLDRMDPGNPSADIAYPVRIRGRLDEGAMERAVHAMIARHESLRTTFPLVDGRPVQLVSPEPATGLKVVDLTALPAAEAEERLRETMVAEASHRFRLEDEPLFRATLLRLGEDHHALILCMHHVVSDGWTLDVIFRELAEMYGAFSHGLPNPLPELPVQYADWAAWQRQRFSGERAHAEGEHWRRVLAGAPAVIDLPTDHPRVASVIQRGGYHRFRIPADVSARIGALAHDEGATPFSAMLALFKVLLVRWTGVHDLLVGTAAANRTRVETEVLIGYFINTIVIRTRLEGDPTFREALRRVRDATYDAFAHGELPYERMVDAVQPEFRPGYPPVFQVQFLLQNATKEMELPGLELELLFGGRTASEFDLTLNVVQVADGLAGGFEYSADLFEEETIDRLCTLLVHLADVATADPDRPISTLALPAGVFAALPHRDPAAGPEAAPVVTIRPPRPLAEVERAIAAAWSAATGGEPLGAGERFLDAADSPRTIDRFRAEFAERFAAPIAAADLVRHPTAAALARHLRFGAGAARDAADRADVDRAAVEPHPTIPIESADPHAPPSAPASGPVPIAIVGLAGRFTASADDDPFGRIFQGGSADDAHLRRIDPADHAAAAFPGVRPADGGTIDPQETLLADAAWEALESAGHGAGRLAERTAVFAGTGASSLAADPRHAARAAEARDAVAASIAWRLGLRGPATTVHAGDATALLAVHQACAALARGACDVAVAGGAAAGAEDGDARGSAGVLVLRRLDDALADGDPVRAVIRGSAAEHGAYVPGFRIADPEADARAVRSALAAAGIDAESAMNDDDAHGSSSTENASTENASTENASAENASAENASTESASAENASAVDTSDDPIARLIAGVLLLGRASADAASNERRADAASFGEVGNEGSIVAPANGGSAEMGGRDEQAEAAARSASAETSRDDSAPAPRRAGVSASGAGVSVHLVLEAAPAREESSPSRPWELLAVSARSEDALDEASRRLAAHLRTHQDDAIGDVAYALARGRRSFAHRRAVLARDAADAADVLEGAAPERLTGGTAGGTTPSVAFVFADAGDGPPAGRELYDAEPVYRDAVDRCAALLLSDLDIDVREVMHRAPGADGDLPPGSLDAAAFVAGHALARVWESWGIFPDAVLGFGAGELAAACEAGIFSLADALSLLVERSRQMAGTGRGALLDVPLDHEAVTPFLLDGASVAEVTSASTCVIGGRYDPVGEVERRLRDAGYDVALRPAPFAFRGPLTKLIPSALSPMIKAMRMSAPRIPFLSTVTGTWLGDQKATDRLYWARTFRAPVLWGAALAELFAEPSRVVLEVGPGQALSARIRRHLSDGGARTPVVASLGAGGPLPADARLRAALGELWCAGADPHWRAVWSAERRRIVPLPPHPSAAARPGGAPPRPGSSAETPWIVDRFDLRPSGSAEPRPAPGVPDERAALGVA